MLRKLDLTKPKETTAEPSTPARSSPNLVSKGQKPAPNPNRPIKESFRENIKNIRKEKDLDEGVSDFALDDINDNSWSALGKDLTPGLGTARSAERTRRSLSAGNYGSAALHGLDTAVSGISDYALATGGGSPVSAVLQAGRAAARIGTKAVSKLASTTGKTVAKEAPKLSSTSSLGKLAKFRQKPQSGKPQSGKPNSKFGLGATLGALGASALKSGGSDDKPLFEPTQQNRPEFGGVIGTSRVTTPKSITGAESGLDASTLQRQRQIYSQMNESNNLNIIKSMIHENVNSQAITIGEETISINKSIAKKIVKLHESLNKTNKKKLERMLNENILSFRKAINFALKQ